MTQHTKMCRQIYGMKSILVFIFLFRHNEQTKAINSLSKDSFYKRKAFTCDGSMSHCSSCPCLPTQFITAALLWHNLGRWIFKGFRVIWTTRCAEMGGEGGRYSLRFLAFRNQQRYNSSYILLLSTTKKTTLPIFRNPCASTYNLTGV